MYGWDADCIGFTGGCGTALNVAGMWNHVVVDHILFGNSSDLQNVILTWYR